MRQSLMQVLSVAIAVFGVGESVDAHDFLGYLSGKNSGDQFGAAMCVVDINADGFADLVVGAPAADDAGLSSGRVTIYFGGPLADTVADLTLIGVASSFFGQSVASAGDFNNDTYDDLLVGAPFYDQPSVSAGGAFLYYGGPSPDTVVDHIFTGEAEGNYFGIAVAAAGDFNNDGVGDIVIGAYQADWGGFDRAGKVYVYYGASSPDYTVDRVLVGEADGERFGYALAAADYNGDTYADIAVGAYSYDSASVINRGRIYMFNGGSSPDTLIDLVVTGDSAGYKFGWSFASGRVNDDLYYDLIMGTDGFSVDTFATGKVFVYFGGPSLDNIADYSHTLGRTRHDYLGDAVSSGVDLNEDGFDEFIAGMPGNDDGATDAGGAILFAGGASPAPDTSVLGGETGEEAGEAVVLWRGYGDLHTYIFAMGASAYGSSRGRVFLFRSQASAVNNPPVLHPIGGKSLKALSNLYFTVIASDPDADSLVMRAEDTPAGALFADNFDGTATFDWTPQLADTGTHTVLFIASDGELADSEYVPIRVTDTASCCVNRGNVDGVIGVGGPVDVADLTYLVAFLFQGGSLPPCEEEGNVDTVVGPGGPIDVADLTYLVAYLFQGGPAPPTC